jgi:hypothetical protein
MDNNWRLQKLEIEYAQWGEKKGQYVGKITFQNGDYEGFTFKLTEEQNQQFIALMSERVIETASQLGQTLLNSLGLIEHTEA